MSPVRRPAVRAARTSTPAAEAVGRAIGLALGPAVALGLARFAYALLLPAMRSDLGWSYAEAGLLNTANAVGYLLGAVGGTGLTSRLDTRRAFSTGLAITTLALVGSAATGNLIILSLLRVVSGASGAVVFIAGAALTAQLAADCRTGRASVLVVGIYSAGAGAGIVVSGVVVPVLLDATGPRGWPACWLAMGVLAVGASAVAALAARGTASPPSPPAGSTSNWRATCLAPVAIGYALFGAGYIAYATFIIAYLRLEGMGGAQTSAFWIVLGLASIAAAFAWGSPLARLRGGRGPAAVMTVVLVGAVLPVAVGGVVAAFASAVLFGGSFLAVVTAVITLAQRTVPAHAITASIGVLTVAFALGQCAGPVLAGVISDGPAGVRAGLIVSAAILSVGILVSLTQRERSARVQTLTTSS